MLPPEPASTAPRSRSSSHLCRAPRARLLPFVSMVWATAGAGHSARPGAAREHALPTGAMHVAVRLSEHPVRLFDGPAARKARVIAHAVVGGARTAPYVRDIPGPVRAVGAQLRPGACEPLFGVPAGELAERHTALEDLWGPAAAALRARLGETETLDQQLTLFESVLAARLPRVHGLHPAVAHALDRFNSTSDVAEVVRQTGYSHRHFVALFRDAVGLAPKRYSGIRRFRRMLARLGRDPGVALSAAALDGGYSDQAHFTREFRRFADLTPGVWRRAVADTSPADRWRRAHHLPIVGGRR